NLNPTVVNGLGDLGRTEVFTQTDFAVRHKFRFGSNERFMLVAEMDVLNLFNEQRELQRATTLSPNNITGSSIGTGSEVATIGKIFNGGIKDLVLKFINDPARPDRRQSIFNKTNGFQDPRSVRFGFRLVF